MRLRLTLDHPPNQILPVNYQYLISSWIYRTLGNADADYAARLHDHGYDFRGRQYRLFTFGPLRPQWFDLDKANRSFRLTTGPTQLELSFYIDEAVQHFVVGLFKDQQFSLTSGAMRADFVVTGIETLRKPNFHTTMCFRTQTPICVSRSVEGEKHAQYMSPEEPGYADYLARNLIRKYQAAQKQLAGHRETDPDIDFPYAFRLLSEVRRKPRTIKGNKIIAFAFDFEITAPIELLEMGYFAGFGEKNSGRWGWGW